MWKHYCGKDQCWISVGIGEACNWCGAIVGYRETPPDQDEHNANEGTTDAQASNSV